MSSKPIGRGHNSGDVHVDPGPATDYFDRGPIAQYPQFDSVAASAFYNAVRSQGDDASRHRAIDLAFERARENAALSANALRIYHRICQNSHGRFRYSTEPHERLASYCSFESATNFHRYMRELIDLGFMARFEFHRHGGGHPYPIYTVVCTADDRSGLTEEILRRKALARRLSPTIPQAILDEKEGIENASIRQNDELQAVDHASIRQDDVSQNVTMTNCTDTNSSKRRVATRQIDDPNLCIKTSEVSEEKCSPTKSETPIAQPGLLDGIDIGSIVEPEIVPLKPVKGRAATSKRPPNGKRPWDWVHESEKRELLTWCKAYAAERNWSPEFLRDRLHAFGLKQQSSKFASADWQAELELWLGDPLRQPRKLSRVGRPSANDIADDVFSYQD